ncbi:MAG: hypothetical protein C0459_00040 [Chitinophaga sp.]|jgi:starch-binding outer membrane protein, SusD/RagB family|nr:hypothetical protein [Chitinophaga sp.]
MKRKILYILTAFIMLGESCSKSELDVQNPNSPTPASAATEAGILALGLGAVYQNGFNGITDSRYTGSFLGSSYWFLGAAYMDELADVITAEAANNITNQISVPDYYIDDNGVKYSNSAPAKAVAKLNNSRTKAGSNMFYYNWTWMYYLNNACNGILSVVDNTSFTGDAISKKNTIKAWAYFWKGYAYSNIASLYYAGLIKNDYVNSNNEYKSSTDMLAEATANYDKAITALNAVTSVSDYNTVIKYLIPTSCQAGKGQAPTTAMWIRNINTLKARNILANKRVSAMTATDWNNILTLVNNGVNATDYVFTERSAATNSPISASGGSIAALTVGNPTGTTYKISERLIQDFKPGDKRLTTNFSTATLYLNQKGGITFSTRYTLLDVPSNGAVVGYASKVVGSYELYIGASYEENELIKAEANIKLGNIATGLASVDLVRTYQGAALSAVSGVVTDPALAYEELRKERRVALLFRNVAFYDARRWGVIDDISAGGGRTNCVVVNSTTGTVNTKATINYNFSDYWDVPDDETSLNPPSATSAPVKNPK